MSDIPMNTANALANLLTSNANASLGLGNYGAEHLYRVSGIEGMNTFQTRPNCEYALFEENSDIFGVKATDASNHASMRYFAFKEITKEEAMREISPYLMKGELDTFKESILADIRSDLKSFKEEIIHAQQSVRNNGSAGNSRTIYDKQQRDSTAEST